MNKLKSEVKSSLATTEESLYHLLERHPFFKNLDPSHLKEIADCARCVSFKSGQSIFREGDPSSEFYAIVHGRIVLHAHSIGRGQITFETLGDGTVLGWSWLIPYYNDKKQFDATAIEETEAIAIDGERIRVTCGKDSKFGYELLKRFLAVMGERLQATRRKLLDVGGECY